MSEYSSTPEQPEKPTPEPIDVLRQSLEAELGRSRAETSATTLNAQVGGDPYELSGIYVTYAQQAARLGEFRQSYEWLKAPKWEGSQVGYDDFLRLAARAARAGELQLSAEIVLELTHEHASARNLPTGNDLRNELAHIVAQQLNAIGHVLGTMNDYRERIQKMGITKAEEALHARAASMLTTLENLRIDHKLPGHEQWPQASENLVAIIIFAKEQFSRANAPEIVARIAKLDPRIRHIANQALKRIIQ